MLTYAGIYIYASLMAIIDTVNSEKYIKKTLAVIFILVLAIISGTRFHLGGTDYYVYRNVFESIPLLDEFFSNFKILDDMYMTYGMEDGYLFLNSLIKTLGFNFYGFILIHSIIFYSLFFYGVSRYTKNMGLVMIIFLYKLFFYNTFISMRQSLTIALFWIMLKFIEERKFIKYIIIWTICIKLHTASMVLLPVYFINRIKMSKKLLIILNCIFIPTIIISILGINLISFMEPIFKYIEDPTVQSKAIGMANNVGGGINLLHTLEYFIIMFLVILNYDKVEKENNATVIKLFVVMLPLFTLFRSVEILTRVKDYFIITYGILLFSICKPQKSKELIYLAIVLYFCLFTFIRFIVLFDAGAMIPYESYIFKDISIFR